MRAFLFRITSIFLFLAAFGVEAPGQGILGTYSLVKDSDGQVPKQQARVEITFRAGGLLSMKAAQPGETVTDAGTYFVRANLITLHFGELAWKANR